MGASRRTWLARLYSDGVEMDWKASSYLFQATTVVSVAFIFRAPSATLKWVARARAGALATRARLASSGVLTSPQCLCCPEENEDDFHVVAGCPATGAADCVILIPRLWQQLLVKRGIKVPTPLDPRGHLPIWHSWRWA